MVIPVHDQNPTRRRAWVTRLLVVANLAIFLISPLGLAGLTETTVDAACGIQAFLDRWGAVPRELTTGESSPLVVGAAVLDPSGAPACELVPPDYDKSPFLSAITAMFLHGGWLHLLGNLLFLAIFGNNVEDRMGRVRFLLFYLGAGIAATYVFAFLHADSSVTLVGASGAIAGILGAYLAWFPRVKIVSLVPFLFFIPVRLPAWLVLGLWFALQWAYTSGTGMEAGQVAYEAHLAGFIAGFLFALAAGRRDPRPPVTRQVQRPGR